MPTGKNRRFILPLVMLLAPAVCAQDSFIARWEALRRAQPVDVDLHIAAPNTTFYLGESIPLTLSFTATQPGTFTADSRLQDRVGRMNYIEEFLTDPAAAAEDPLRGLPGESGGMGGLSGGPAMLTAHKPFTVERTLNEWVRFRGPGTYRLYVLSRRVRQAAGTAQSHVEVASNVLTLRIVAAPPEWVSRQIAEATAVLDGPIGYDTEDAHARQRAGLTLRLLNTLESGIALARRLPAENSVDAFAVHSGILDSAHRAQLLPVLEQLLVAPGQAISGRFLTTLAQLAVLVESGGDIQRRAALTAAKREHFVSILVRSLPNKEPQARALTRDALVGVAEASGTQPWWLAGIVESLIVDFRALPALIQSSLLDSRWRLLRDRDVLPLLNDLYAYPPQPVGYPPLGELVLNRIYELNPERGRQLILAELKRPDGPRWGDRTLMMLPDENLPELNEVFAAQLARGGPLPAQLITRYATGDIVRKVEAAYLAFNAELDRQKRTGPAAGAKPERNTRPEGPAAEVRRARVPQELHHCPFPIVFYFLKFDPEFGERELRKAFAAGPCYDIGRAFDSLGPYAMSPALERLAIEHLMSPIVAVKRGAAEVLGKYGSPAAEKPLWAAMEYFRSWWKGREDDLRKPVGQEGILLERALRTALAQAGAWVLSEAELRRLLTLCSSEECRADVQEWIRETRSQ